MCPTMADVAKQANVSISTVSLVLNKKPGVSTRMRTAVIQAANKLGYALPSREHYRASSTPTITVVHFASPDQRSQDSLTDLAAIYVSGICDFCQSKHVNWTLIAHHNKGSNHVDLGKPAADGLILIFAPSQDLEILQVALRDKIPTVVISRDWPDLPVNTVGQDHYQQARLAVDHLVKLGHRKIAFCARRVDEPYDWFKIRLDHYCEVMTRLGEYASDRIVVAADLPQATQAMITNHPDITAIFGVHDDAALLAIQGLQEMDLQVPEQVSVIGVGNTVSHSAAYPDLTTVGFPARKVGYLAAKTLLDQIQDSDLPHSRIFVPSWIVDRKSCAPPRKERII